MLSKVKPKQPIELPTQSPDDHILQQVNQRFARQRTPGLVQRGLRGSSTGIALGQGLSLEEQELAEQYKQENPNWIRDGVETMLNMAASLPVFAAGEVAGTAAFGPVGGAAGGFALDTAVRETYQGYLQAVKRGETTLSFDDWIHVAKESGKSGLLGGALKVAAPFLQLATNNQAVGKLLKTPLSKAAADLAVEAGAFTVGGAAIGHGELSFEAFRDNLITLGGLRLGHKAIKELYKEHKETGKPPEQLLLEYKPKPEEQKQIEYKPKVITPEITPEQKAAADRITQEQKAPKEPEKPKKTAEEKQKEDTQFIKDLKKDLEERVKPIREKAEKIHAHELREKEKVYQKQAELAGKLKGRMEGLKRKQENLQEMANFESPKNMKKPLGERLNEVVAEKEADVKRLYTDLRKSQEAKEPRVVKDLIREKIRKAEAEIKELNAAKRKREKVTVAESANKIKKTKGSKDYVEQTNRSADRIAEDVLDKIERNSDRHMAYESIAKDLEPMGIKLRCL